MSPFYPNELVKSGQSTINELKKSLIQLGKLVFQPEMDRPYVSICDYAYD